VLTLGRWFSRPSVSPRLVADNGCEVLELAAAVVVDEGVGRGGRADDADHVAAVVDAASDASGLEGFQGLGVHPGCPTASAQLPPKLGTRRRRLNRRYLLHEPL
jgi:hypothetical protein